MNASIRAVIATCVALLSAICSLAGIVLNFWYDKKTYKANLQIRSKLEFIDPIKKLVPDYIAATNYTLYLYSKG